MGELDARIEKALNQFNSSAASSATFIEGEKANEETQSIQNDANDMEVVCEGGVCYKILKQKAAEQTEASTSTDSATASPSTDEKVQRAKELIEKKRKEKEEEEKRVSSDMT